MIGFLGDFLFAENLEEARLLVIGEQGFLPEESVASWAFRFAASQQVYYNNIALNDHGKAGDCIKCGKCEQACQQHLSIREYLEKVEEKFEKGSTLPVRK